MISGRSVVRRWQERDVAARDDHLVVGVRRISFRESIGHGERVVAKSGMVLIDAGVDDADLDSDAGIGFAAE